MKQGPNLWELETLLKEPKHQVQKEINGKWVPARPVGLDSLRSRLRLAWMVFRGEADVVKWPGGQ